LRLRSRLLSCAPCRSDAPVRVARSASLQSGKLLATARPRTTAGRRQPGCDNHQAVVRLSASSRQRCWTAPSGTAPTTMAPVAWLAPVAAARLPLPLMQRLPRRATRRWTCCSTPHPELQWLACSSGTACVSMTRRCGRVWMRMSRRWRQRERQWRQWQRRHGWRAIDQFKRPVHASPSGATGSATAAESLAAHEHHDTRGLRNPLLFLMAAWRRRSSARGGTATAGAWSRRWA